MSKRILPALLFFFLSAAPSYALNTERLSPQENEMLRSILTRLDPVISQLKENGNANLLSWETMIGSISESEIGFIDSMRKIKAEKLGATSHYFGESQKQLELVQLAPRKIARGGKTIEIDAQYLPSEVFKAYNEMMSAMRSDIGKILFVESGYRSPAYQLYLFMFFMPKHGYSIRETNRFVALPGYSEHGNPERQAIDFINEEGINGEDHPEEFEALEEYKWLLKNAGRFGFYLSYPRNNIYNTSFEPWHWHYENSKQRHAASNQ